LPQEAAQLIADLSSGRAGRLPLVAGPLCLNFTNTASGRDTETHQDHLRVYGDLLAWSLHAGALPADIVQDLAEIARRKPAAARRVLVSAVTFREALHQVGVALAAHKTPPADAVGEINRASAVASQAGRLEWTGAGFAWRLVMRPARLDLPLWPIARSAVETLLGAPLERLKECAGVHCGWLFLDETRNGKRRWCEMEVCGSRAKMRRFRHKHANGHPL
jgi:predicted RNA-binding Zn ribbon-like protein